MRGRQQPPVAAALALRQAGLHTESALGVWWSYPPFRWRVDPGSVDGRCSLGLDLEGSSPARLDDVRGSSDREGFDVGEVGARRVGVFAPALGTSLGTVSTADGSEGGRVASTVDLEGETFAVGSVPPPSLLERFIGACDILARPGYDGVVLGALMRHASGPCFETVASRSGPSAGGGHAAPTGQCGLLGVADLLSSGVRASGLGGASAESPRRAGWACEVATRWISASR